MRHFGSLEVTATFTAKQVIVKKIDLLETIKKLEKRIERLENKDSSEQSETVD